MRSLSKLYLGFGRNADAKRKQREAITLIHRLITTPAADARFKNIIAAPELKAAY